MFDPSKTRLLHETSFAQPQEAVAALLTPALFERARHLGAAQMLHHLPFLFWLIDTARPGRIVEIGLDQGVSYFAACQAVERQGSGAACTGIAARTEGAPDALVAHNDRHYREFSELVAQPPRAALERVAPRSVDLLILDVPPGEAAALLEAGWRERVAENGIVLIHRSGEAEAEDRLYLDGLHRSYDSVEFAHGKGLLMLCTGAAPSERVARLVELGHGTDETGGADETLWRMFARLGRGQAAEGDLAAAQQARAAAQARLEKIEAEAGPRAATAQAHDARIDRLQAERDAARCRESGLEAALLDHDMEMARMHERYERLQHDHDAVQDAQAKLRAEIETLSRRDLEHGAAAEASAAERQRLMKIIAQRDAALTETAAKAADAGQERDGLAALLKEMRAAETARDERFAEQDAALAQARHELADLVRHIEEREAEIHGLRQSTSWRITAPLRAVSLKLRR